MVGDNTSSDKIGELVDSYDTSQPWKRVNVRVISARSCQTPNPPPKPGESLR